MILFFILLYVFNFIYASFGIVQPFFLLSLFAFASSFVLSNVLLVVFQAYQPRN